MNETQSNRDAPWKEELLPTRLVCTYCGEEPPPEKLIHEGIYAGGHLRSLTTAEALRVGYPEDPCGPVREVPR